MKTDTVFIYKKRVSANFTQMLLCLIKCLPCIKYSSRPHEGRVGGNIKKKKQRKEEKEKEKLVSAGILGKKYFQLFNNLSNYSITYQIQWMEWGRM